MALVTVAELKSALGIGNTYPDADIQAVCNAAIAVIDPMLRYKRFPLSACTYDLATHTAIYETPVPHRFNIGDNVTISTYEGSPFTGTQTITAVTAYSFTTDKNHTSQHDREWLIPYGSAIDNEQAALYDTAANVKQAALAVAIDVWQVRMGTYGQSGPDMAPAPYKMGKGLVTRVMGLLGPSVDTASMVG